MEKCYPNVTYPDEVVEATVVVAAATPAVSTTACAPREEPPSVKASVLAEDMVVVPRSAMTVPEHDPDCEAVILHPNSIVSVSPVLSSV